MKRTGRRQGRRNATERQPGGDEINDYLINDGSVSRRGHLTITHLLDVYAKTPLDQAGPSHWAAGRPRHQPSNFRTRLRHLDGPRYVNANFRFLVRSARTATADPTDPDSLVNWDNVAQVLASQASQMAPCLFCFDSPVAARMLECGHIFCMSCLARFALSRAPNRDDGTAGSVGPDQVGKLPLDCPACSAHFTIGSSRAVRWYSAPAGPEECVQENTEVVLRLMQRQPGTLLCLPYESDGSDEGAENDDDRPARDPAAGPVESIPMHDQAGALEHARVMVATPDYINAQFEADIDAIEARRKHDALMFGDETQAEVKMAADLIGRERRLMFVNYEAGSTNSTSLQPATTTPTTSATTAKTIRPAEPPGGTAKSNEYFFYTTPLHHYLCALDIRILLKAFGSYRNFPAVIVARVEHVSTGWTVDQELRRRVRYLSHLPIGCSIAFLECNLAGVVPEPVLAMFAAELGQRRKAHRDRTAKEDSDRDRAEMLEREMLLGELGASRNWGSSSSTTKKDTSPMGMTGPGSLGDVGDLPGTGSDGVTGPTGPRFGPLPGEQPSGETTTAGSEEDERKNGKTTVWGTALVADTSGQENEGGREESGWSGWNDELPVLSSGPSSGSGGGKRGRRGKKIVLMGTNVRRGA